MATADSMARKAAAARSKKTADRLERDKKKRAVIQRPPVRAKLTSPYAKPKSRLSPKTKDSVTVAQVHKILADTLTKLGGNPDSNKNWRKSANRNLAKAKAQAGARSKSARSQMAVTRSRTPKNS